MKKYWLEIIRANLEEVEGSPGFFRNRRSSTEHPFHLEHSLRVILGAGELAPFSSVPHGHLSFYKGAPGGEDVLLDTNHEFFLVVKSQSSDTQDAHGKGLQVRSHTHHIPWEKIVDLELIELKSSLGG
jgi:hypothetical protein